MAFNAPGKHFREGISLIQLFKMFPDDAAAERWFVSVRWAAGPVCPHCGSLNVQCGIKHKTMTHRCRDCPTRRMFSLKTGTVMEGSKLGYQTWAIALYLLATGIKGTASMKLHRDLKITQKTAWHLAHRIRQSWAQRGVPFLGPVEVDETFVGGKAKNMHAVERKRRITGTGGMDKTAVAGVRDRRTKRVSAAVVPNVEQGTLVGFVADRTEPGVTLYTDEHAAYRGLANHASVKHGVGEYVNGQIHTNGLESFWSLFKRGFHGIYHKMSPAHLNHYVDEFVGRHNQRPLDTLEQMDAMVRGFECKRLRYADLIEDRGLPTGARPQA